MKLFQRQPAFDRIELHRAYLRLHHFGFALTLISECEGGNAPVQPMSWPSVIRLAERVRLLYGDA